ncbi:hypothetical protein OC846_004010 [Tilletia horrida]|uniref:Uncharacterized protein n=1 Tax=Tilletia horrida TaxID=155126 RepID=A0AAN6GPG9_9BASI|nr:hypothetical protein OC846_004010 [Tilletia horrida]KAK0564250.1 hypothetical protein OC861_004398 [Tilletia horrida]
MAALHSAQGLNNRLHDERSMSYSNQNGGGARFRIGSTAGSVGYHANSSQTRLQSRNSSNTDLPLRIESANMPGTPRRPPPLTRNPISLSQPRRPSEIQEMSLSGRQHQDSDPYPPASATRHSSTLAGSYATNHSSNFYERMGTELWNGGTQWHSTAPDAMRNSAGDPFDLTIPAFVPHTHSSRSAQSPSGTGGAAKPGSNSSVPDVDKEMTRKGFSESIRQHRRPTELSISPPRTGSVRADRAPAIRAGTQLSHSASSSALITRTHEAGNPSRPLQSSAEVDKTAATAVKSPKSGTSRIAKLRAAWSPKTKTINPPPLVPESPSAGNKKTALSFGMVAPARLKQRVSVANIGSPTLMRFTTLNEHGEVVNIENPTSGMLPLDRAIPLTSLQAAAKLAGSTSSLPPTADRSSLPSKAKAGRLSDEQSRDSQRQNSERGSSEDGNGRNASLEQSRPTVAADVRLQRHASVESLPLSKSFDALRGSRSQSTVDLNLPGISRAPYTRLRALRERSMTQGEYTSTSRMDASPSNPLNVETRASRSGSLRQPRSGLHTVSETQDLERESPNPQASIPTVNPLPFAGHLATGAGVSRPYVVQADDLSPTEVIHKCDAEEEPSLPTMWSQASDMTGYTASSESGFPAPDALGLVLAGSRARESIVFQSGLPIADLGSDSSTAASHISQSTQTPERTPSTLATASIHSSPVFMKGDHTFGSTAPRSPVNRRRVHVRAATADLSHSPSLDQILPDVELNTLGTPMPDTDLENEIFQAEQTHQPERVGSPLGINLLGLSQMCTSPERQSHSHSGTDTPLPSSRPPFAQISDEHAESVRKSVHSGTMSRTSSTSTQAVNRPQRKYAFEKITSPEQHKLILEEEEWMCRGLDNDDLSPQHAILAASSSRAPVHVDNCASDDSEDQDCTSIYEVSSVEGSQDEHERRNQSMGGNESQDSGAVSRSNSGWDSSPERGILGMYADSLSGGSAILNQDTTESSPQEMSRMPAKRDTVESLLLRAADLLADRGGALPPPRNPVRDLASIATRSSPGPDTILDDPDLEVELVPEGLEVAGPVDPLTGLITYQLKWKVVLRTSKAPKATTTESVGVCKVVRGTSTVTSPASVCTSLPSLQTPQNRSIAFPPRSPVQESPKTLITVPARYQSMDQSFSNPFVPGQALHNPNADESGTAGPTWPAFHLRTASYPDIALSSSKGSPDKSADLSGATQVAASPQSPAFCPKPLLLVQSSELRSNRRRFDSNAESTSSPVSKTSSEFSRPFLGRDGRSVTSSPALDPLNGRRRQISYIGSNNGHQNASYSSGGGRGSFERVRAVSGQRSPFLSSKSPAYNHGANFGAEDSPASITPRSNIGANHLEHLPSSSQVLGLSTASSRLAAVTGGRP